MMNRTLKSLSAPRHNPVWLSVLALISFLSGAGCTRTEDFTDDSSCRLLFSTDTLSFDTVFATVSSATSGFVVYNRNDAGLRFSVTLAGGMESAFRINVDGQSGTTFRNVEILSNDSLYCFVAVLTEESGEDLPILTEDSIMFLLESGIRQTVHLEAYGQDVVKLRGCVLDDEETVFTSARPYLIYDSLVVDSGALLKLQKGTRLHFHDRAFLRINGRVEADGTPDSMILMCGDRLDRMLTNIPYDLVSGRWGGVLIGSGSTGNRFVGCDIHGGSWGIMTDTCNSAAEDIYLIDGCIIHNVSGDGLQLNNTSGHVRNSLISNAAGNCVSLLGGSNEFRFCTIANFYPWDLSGVALYLANVSDSLSFPMSRAEFVSCIVTGFGTDQIELQVNDSIAGQGPDLVGNYRISSSLILTEDTLNTRLAGNVWDLERNPVHGSGNFLHVAQGDFRYDYHLDSLSMARGISSSSALCPTDITGLQRPDSLADAGCYQFSDAH